MWNLTLKESRNGVFSYRLHLSLSPAVWSPLVSLPCQFHSSFPLSTHILHTHGPTQQLQLWSLSQLYVIFEFKHEHNRERWIPLRPNFKSQEGCWYFNFGSYLAVHSETELFLINVYVGTYMEETGRLLNCLIQACLVNIAVLFQRENGHKAWPHEMK